MLNQVKIYIIYLCLDVGYLLRFFGIVLLSWFPFRFPLTFIYCRVIDIHGRYLYI